jgi:hypothetical protein
MQLDSYACEICILQKEERLRHLFFKCSFGRNCWLQIGVIVSTWLKPTRATRYIKRMLRVPFAMEIIITMCWCIKSERNEWLFNNVHPLVGNCKAKLKKEFDMVIHRSKISRKYDIKSWLCNISYLFVFCILYFLKSKNQ